jgi:hypothetical protein
MKVIVLRSTRYRLEAANDAIDDLCRGRIRGRVILGPGSRFTTDKGTTGHGRFWPVPYRRPCRGGDLPGRVADHGVLRR